MGKMFEKVSDTIVGTAVRKKIETIEVDAAKIAYLINQSFLIGVSSEEFAAAKKYIRQEFNIFQVVKPIVSKDKLHVLNITKYNRAVKLSKHRILFVDNTDNAKSTMYLYKCFSYKDFLNAMNPYLEPHIYGAPVNAGIPAAQPAAAVQYVNNNPPAPMPAGEKIKCPSCGGEINKGAKFCPSCGSPVERHCPGCNAVVSGTAKFCPSCGKQL